MNKKTKKFMTAIAGTTAAFTLLCATVTAAESIPVAGGANSYYLLNSGEDYEVQVNVPKNHFLSASINNQKLAETDLSVEGTSQTAPTGTTETSKAPSRTQTPGTTAAPGTTEAPPVTSEAPYTTEAPVTSEAPYTTEAPVYTTEAPVYTTEAPVYTTEAPVDTTEPPAATESIDTYGTVNSNAAGLEAEGVILAAVDYAAPIEADAAEYYTKIKIAASYMNTLQEGKYTLALNFVEGSAVVDFTVTKDASLVNGSNPSTGDSTHVLPYVLLAACSAGALVFLAKRGKKEA